MIVWPFVYVFMHMNEEIETHLMVIRDLFDGVSLLCNFPLNINLLQFFRF